MAMTGESNEGWETKGSAMALLYDIATLSVTSLPVISVHLIFSVLVTIAGHIGIPWNSI